MIPVIINNRNRLTTLKALIQSLPETRIIILDNDSTYKPLLDFYQNLPQHVELVRLGKNIGHFAFIEWGGYKDFKDQYFVYTDSDIVLTEDCPKDCLDYLVKIKKKYPQYDKVGLSLKIDDIPNYYTYKRSILSLERHYWKNSISDEELGTLWLAEIDTTFVLHDKDNVKKSIKNAIRTDMPYSARHMPWYLDKNNLSEEEFYYIKHCTAICDNRRVGVYSNAHRKWFNHFIRMI